MTDTDLTRLLVPALAGLGGVLVGAWLSARRDREHRRLSFIEKQLERVYSPLVGIRDEIVLHGNVRKKISETADLKWREICNEASAIDVDRAEFVVRQRGSEFTRIIEYNNKTLKGELIPRYKDIAKILRDHYWLADTSTRTYLPALLEYIDIWDRWLDHSLPVEVMRELDTYDDQLSDFFEHVALQHDKLRNKLKRAEP